MAVKIVEDNMKNAKGIFTEAFELTMALYNAYSWVQPSASPEAVNAGGPAKYIVAGRTHLQNLPLNGFDRLYPALHSTVSSGTATNESNPRLVDGIFKIGKLHQFLTDNRYMLKTDAQRQTAREFIAVIIGDLAIFMISQFQLANPSTVFLSVSESCSKLGITKDVAYGTLLNAMDTVGQAPYGYEEASPYYDELTGVDAAFLSECEEASYPLTEDICVRIIDGSLPIAEARGLLAEYKQSSREVEITGMDASNMVTKLQLG